ncbi:MAG: hypothetical protein IPI92_04665 [Gemmatimonadetes bacterium]|nr:hypothetical protein [Gemmatimonadota bacterium]MBK7783769.1 hypothetical protein [Gemmatimonadota bacterium]
MTPDVKAPPLPDPAVAAAPAEPPGRRAATPPDDGVERLRAIIVGREREAVRRLEQRLDDPVALAPVVERALTSSVKRDPRPLADALFPVMGPAIRRAISQALAGLLQSVNHALEQSFSLQGLAWRWEAMRTGASFAEVVLRHTLLYRVEQVFLVHRESGLLLHHLTAQSIAAQAPDMVAGMLTAIQDFARDSFQVAQEEMLETMQVGELTVWVEQGGRTLLAAVIRGHAPVELRVELQRTLEEIEAAHAPGLLKFNGDASVFDRSRPKLEALLLAETRDGPAAGHAPWRTWLLLAVAAGLLLFLGIPAVIRQHRWDGYVARLRNEPGVVVTHATREDGRFVVRGLRDPLASDPAALLGEFRLDTSQVRGQWQPYVALLPGFVLRRAERALAPPATVTLRVAGDTLVAGGAATAEWFARAGGLAPALSGVGTYREERVAARDLPAVAPLVAAVEGRRLRFPSGVAAVEGAAAQELSALAADVARLDSVARGLGLTLQLVLAGSADDVGNEDVNERLRRLRAETARDALVPLLPPTLPVALTTLPPDSGVAVTDSVRALRRSARALVTLLLPAGEAAP